MTNALKTNKAAVAVIQFPGVNCEYETVRVLEAVGLQARIVRWNDKAPQLNEAAAVLIPGGFSYQDRIRAGVVAAKDRIMDAVLEVAAHGKPVMGICNGAQILVEAGAVTGTHAGNIDLVLADNRMPDRAGYYCDWVRLTKGPAQCIFTLFMDDLSGEEAILPIPMAHGEGRFVSASREVQANLRAGDGVALYYSGANGQPAHDFPDNPNGSFCAIAGVTNPAGNVLALMPHPERAAWLHQVPLRAGGPWAKKRAALTKDAGDIFAAGPGLGFFRALQRVLAS